MRLVARGIAEKNFAKWADDLKDVPVSNERQQLRLDVLKWTAAVDCPSRAQINPVTGASGSGPKPLPGKRRQSSMSYTSPGKF